MGNDQQVKNVPLVKAILITRVIANYSVIRYYFKKCGMYTCMAAAIDQVLKLIALIQNIL